MVILTYSFTMLRKMSSVVKSCEIKHNRIEHMYNYTSSVVDWRQFFERY